MIRDDTMEKRDPDGLDPWRSTYNAPIIRGFAVEVRVVIEVVMDRSMDERDFFNVLLFLNRAIAPSHCRRGWCEFF